MTVLLDGHKTQDFYCNLSRFDEYKAERIDNQWCIVASKGFPNRKPFKIVTRNRTELLQRFLLLYEDLTSDMYGRIEERITEKDLQTLCYWCRGNGTPIESYGSEDSLWEKENKVGFYVNTFYNRLHDLYSCYLLWRRIFMQDISEKNYYVRENVSREDCIESLNAHYCTMNITLRPDFSADPPSYNLWCGDLLEIAKAQLFFECMQTDYYSIGVCSVCGRPFARTRKNNTLCVECQRTKYKRTRERQRMSANIDNIEREDENAEKGNDKTCAR